MTKYYSPSSGGFYSEDIHDKRVMPSDVLDITDEEWRRLLDEQTTGKQIVKGTNGYPVAVDRTITVDIIDLRNRALSESDWLVARHRDELEQDPTETTLTSQQYSDLQAWRRALRAITADATKLPPRPV